MTAPTVLLGRDRESARLRRMLSTAIEGTCGGLTVCGAAGAGKTTLLEHVTGALPGHRVLRLQAIATEAALPYSTLQLLCSALAPELALLDDNRRQALETVVGLDSGPAPSPLLVRVALVDLLSRAAESSPLVCVVDDAQWLDRASADVLAFAARRTAAASVALVLAGRGPLSFDLPRLVVGGLGHPDARRLLEAALPGPLDRAVVNRIVAEARGIPELLVNFARTAADLSGGYGVPPSAAGETDLAALTPAGRSLLVLASAEPLGDPARLWRAASRLGIPRSAAEPLESAGLLSFGVWVTFRHPGLRSEVYGSVSAARRRLAHDALAFATDPSTDPDRRAWHQALALVGPDDAVADELARTAGIARRRGGLAAEAAFLERAALCSTDSVQRVARTVLAADVHQSAGAPDIAVRLLSSVDTQAADASTWARAKRVHARMGFDTNHRPSHVEQLFEVAQHFESCDPDQAQPAFLEALAAATFTGHVDVLRTASEPFTRPKGPERLADGVLQQCARGYAAALEPLKLALKTLDYGHEDEPRSQLLACLVVPELWDDDAWHDLTGKALVSARALGARGVVPYALAHRALLEIHTGRFAAARALIAEALSLTDDAGTMGFPHVPDVLAAWCGEPVPEASHGADLPAELSRYANAVLANGMGDYGVALAATAGVLERDSLQWQGWALVELVEAAVRSGERSVAAQAFDRLSERAFLSGTDWALGVAARSRALLDESPRAESTYREAIDRLSRSRITTHVARAQLVYGEWLRRQGRRVDARLPLKAAAAAFTRMGAAAFAVRANRELLATGARARRRVPETHSQLTPQEREIAALARGGRSNPDIAIALTISPRTVEYHLHKVFIKLGIRSRTELHLVLSDDA